MSTMPTQHGESVVMRLLNQRSGLLGLDNLGMPADMLVRFREIMTTGLDKVHEALVEGLAEFSGPDGVRAPASTWLVTARSPA